jgi:Rha family phage regulatory protein
MNLVNIEKGQLKTTSKIIADVFGKTHRDVLRAIRLMDCNQEFRLRNFVPTTYTSPQNKKISCVDITRDGFMFLGMGFTGKKAAIWKINYLNAFNEMESGLLSFDKRMTEISLERDELKQVGIKWSALGREIKSRKDIHIARSNQLLDDVQLKLEY